MAKIGFTLIADKPEDISGRGWQEALKAGWFAVGMYHDEVVQPRKFETGAAQRYGYQTRTAKYLDRKKRLAQHSYRVKDGGEKDLVYSGATRTIVLRRQYPRPFPTRVWLEIPTPSYVQMRPNTNNWSMPAMGIELTSITPDEQAQMEKIFVLAVEKRLDEIRERTVRKAGN